MAETLLDRSRALFIRRWGEMAASWGISRTMAEIHALLFISSEPLCTDDLMEQLQISRGNASMNIRQLVAWGLIERVHRRGDRKEYFVAESDVWQMFETIFRERRRREVEPIMETISKCRSMLDDELQSGGETRRDEIKLFRRRLDDMQRFFNVGNTVFNAVTKLGKSRLGEVKKVLGQLTR